MYLRVKFRCCRHGLPGPIAISHHKGKAVRAGRKCVAFHVRHGRKVGVAKTTPAVCKGCAGANEPAFFLKTLAHQRSRRTRAEEVKVAAFPPEAQRSLHHRRAGDEQLRAAV
jgi:hypothetical protein